MPADQPNVLFLLSDEHTFRGFSHLDDDRGEPVDTPTFDDLAANAAVFDQAYCSMPLCTPSRLCLLSGREARNAGAWANRSHLSPSLSTLPETLGEGGYETCLVGKMHLGGNRQFVGFDHRPYGDLTGGTGHQWDPPTPDQKGGNPPRRRTLDAGITEIPESLLQERAVVQETLSFLREHRHASPDQPWFLTASFSRPHFPLTAPARYVDRYPPEAVPEPKVGHEGDTTDHPMTQGAREGFRCDAVDREERQRARAGYFACIDFLDEIIEDLLATLERDGLLENTIVIYASDHGELAGEHGLWWKHTWHEASARVPWFIQLPEHRSGDLESERIETPVSLADLYPTVCGLTGRAVPGDLDGVDLSAAVQTGREPDRGPVFCDNLIPRWGEGTEFRMVRDGRYKYVGFRNQPDLLFDIEADPLEQRNLATDPDASVDAVLDRLGALVEKTMDFDAAERERNRDEEALEAEYRLGAPEGTGNAYQLPDGRVVDADTPLYRPSVLIEEPEVVFDAYPEQE